MLKDITLGQYFPGESVIHRLDARFKIILTTLFIVMLFVTQKALGLAVGGVFCLFAIALSRIPAKMFVKSIKPIVPILIFTSLLNLLFIDKGTVLFAWKFIHITQGGIQTSVFMVIRIMFLIAGTSLLTYTTSPIQLTDAIERLLSPLKKLHVPVHELAMMMTIALRFIPTLIEETDKIMAAQKARGGGSGKRQSDAACKGADSHSDPPVCVRIPPGGGACHRHGMSVLPGRRGTHPAAADAVRCPGLYSPGRYLCFSGGSIVLPRLI